MRLTQRVEVLDTLVREPMLVEHPSGALFVAGYNRVRPGLWKSVDHGTTWRRIAVGDSASGAIGNSDVSLAVAHDGTLYFVSMGFDRAKGEGTHVSVGVSSDVGATWRWTTLSRTRFVDRPWIVVAPDGSAHAIWNDGHVVAYVASRDRGVTWSAPMRLTTRGGSSHFAVGPHGELAVRVIPGNASGNECHDDVDRLAVSTDRGATWRMRPAPDGPRANGCSFDARDRPRWVDPIAWDASGALYALWADDTRISLARSLDAGATWTSWLVARADSGARFPYLAAGAPGELAATWFTGLDDAPVRWTAARISLQGAAPSVSMTTPAVLESWNGTPPNPDTGGEYLATALLRDGTMAVVTPIQHADSGRLGFTWWRFGAR